MKLPVNYNKTHYSKRKLVREAYIKEQDGNCCHCGSPLTEEPPQSITAMEVNERLFPQGFFKNPIHLHHSHDTEMTIGAVHAYCNAVLWQFHGE